MVKLNLGKVIGPAGKDGYTPVKGVDYFDGKDGERGPEGRIGPQGEDGEVGPAGKDGYTPVKGVDYFDGKDGDVGPEGSIGPIGPPGKDGKDAPVYTAGENITIDDNFKISASGGMDQIPIATENVVGGIKATLRDPSVDTKEVKIDGSSGVLYTEPCEGGITPELKSNIASNSYMVNLLYGRSTDWSHLFNGVVLDDFDFANFKAPGHLHDFSEDPYNLSNMFNGATFGTPPEGYDLPADSFWGWYRDFETWMGIMLISSMEAMFANTKGDTIELPELRLRDSVSGRRMFEDSRVTNIILDEFLFLNDTSRMFSGTSATSLDLRYFDTSNVTNMSSMFSWSSATTLDLRSFDTSNVTDMSRMFYNAAATTLDLSSFDTSNVTDLDYMFRIAKATVGYARTQEDADRFNNSSGIPDHLTFVVKE